MLEQFLRRFPLELLQRHAGIASVDLQQLRDWQQDANAGTPVPLLQLHNLLVRINRRLQS